MDAHLDKETIAKLIGEAKDISSRNFCCKYSNFQVGAALITKDGTIIKGFNIENHGIQSICAERVAFTKALSDGYKDFIAIAVVGKRIGDEFFEKTLPCGYCRQFMSEYASQDFLIYSYDEEKNEVNEYQLRELLPEGFRSEN